MRAVVKRSVALTSRSCHRIELKGPSTNTKHCAVLTGHKHVVFVMWHGPV